MGNLYTDEQAATAKFGWGGLSGSTVKMVGIVTMFIDHVGAALIARILLGGGYTQELYRFYMVLREIGRLGFPIFCFLLVEGFDKTHSKVKYGIRLGVFALISEIPFDLVFLSRVLEFSYQNVFFTLLLGFLCLCVFDFLEKKKMPKALTLVLDLAVLAVFMWTAKFLRSDYGAMGVLAIAVIYMLRRFKAMSMAGGCVILCLKNLNELPAFFTLIPIALYNGKRGWKLKYFFYAFYPAHLLLLWLVAQLLGMGSIPVM